MAEKRLRPRHWRWVAAAMVALMALAGLYRLLLTRAEARARDGWETRLAATARNRGATVERWFQDLRSDAATVATYPTAIWLLGVRPPGPLPFPAEEGAAAHLSELLRGATHTHGYRAGWVLDARGRVVASTTREVPPIFGVTLAASAARAGAARVGLGREHGRPALLIAAPITRPGTTERLGSVLLEEDPRGFLYPLLESEPVPSGTGETLIVERGPGSVTVLSPTRKLAVAFRPLRSSAQPSSAPPPGFALEEHGSDYAGDAVWLVRRPLAGTAWELVAKVDRGEALAPAKGEALLELLAVAGVLAALLGISFGVWRQHQSERQAAAAALRESEERYRAIVENSPDVIGRLDREARFLYMSPSISRYVQVPPGEFVGRRAHELGFPRELCEPLDEAARQVFVDGAPREFEVAGPTAIGPRQFVWRFFPEYDDEGRICAVVTVGQDVTERRRLEEEYRHGQKLEAIGRLAGGVAHDFNNILTAIHGNAALARAELKEGEPLAAELDEIMMSADRAAALTRQLLAFSRRQMLQPQHMDLAATIRSLAPMLRRLIGEQVELSCTLPEAPLHIRADRSQVEQILLNLCVNARDAMPDGGRITLTLDEQWLAPDGLAPGRYAVLRVSDTGSGMSADVLERAFEPFFTTKDQGRGTGLGLATVYGIVQQSGGHIAVESEPERGTRFTVCLPRDLEEGEEPVAPEAALPAVQPGRTVLLAEDDAVVRRLTERLLRSRGYRVLSAANGAEALQVADTEPGIDLLLTDVVMPEVGGIELAKRLRAVRPSLRVVFMTGYTQDFTEQVGPIDPTMHVVHKPFNGVDLLSRLEHALDGTPIASA